ncbi:sigma factor [Kitasatospora sp. NPDC001159]
MIGKKRRAEESAEFEAFAHSRGQRLFRTALLLCGDWHLAEDLTQVTLAKLYASWPKVRRAENQDAYARSTLVRSHLSHRRLRRTGERPALGEWPARSTTTAPAPPTSGSRSRGVSGTTSRTTPTPPSRT